MCGSDYHQGIAAYASTVEYVSIAQILSNKGVSDLLIKELHRVLSTAEFARYAPTSDHAMQDLYNDTTNIINQLENCKL